MELTHVALLRWSMIIPEDRLTLINCNVSLDPLNCSVHMTNNNIVINNINQQINNNNSN